MKRYVIHSKPRDIEECDGGCADGGFSADFGGYGDLAFGMGPVNPMGGPDRWDMGFKFDSSKPKRYKVKRRRKR